MKEAAGEANLKVIAILLIGVIAAVVTPMVNSYMTTSAKKGCCTNYGGYWANNQCKMRNAAVTEQTVNANSYWNQNDRTCK